MRLVGGDVNDGVSSPRLRWSWHGGMRPLWGQGIVCQALGQYKSLSMADGSRALIEGRGGRMCLKILLLFYRVFIVVHQ